MTEEIPSSRRESSSPNKQSAPVTMILAAGFGTRMAPLSRTIPKALLPVLGRPLLEWVLRHLAMQGVTRTVVNVHHLHEPVIDWSARHAATEFIVGDARSTLPHVHVIHEPSILGTGGGIANAAPLLTSDPVLIHNVDLLLRFDLSALLAVHRAGGHTATLALVRDPEHAQIGVSGSRVTQIASRPDPAARDLWCFSGVSLLSQTAIQELPRGGFVELTPHLRRWARDGRLGAYLETAPFLEVGTIESYLEVNRELASSAFDQYVTGSPPPGLLRPGFESIFAPDSIIGDRAVIRASVGLAGAVVPSGTHLDRVVLGAGLPPEPVLERAVCFEGEIRPIRVLSSDDETTCRRFVEQHPIPHMEHGGPDASPAGISRRDASGIRLHLMHGDGSRRRIVRAIAVDATGIVVLNPPAPDSPNYPRLRGTGVPDENETFCYVAEHLAGIGVRVPRIHAFDRSQGILLLEDLGSTRLADLKPTEVGHYEQSYLEAVEVLARIQQRGSDSFAPDRTFNVEYDAPFVLRYEIEYFQREMVERYAGLGPASRELRDEYETIAKRAGSAADRVLMHRDFQSRNLMVTRDGIAVIDFQGARLGPPEYDLASLILDPYVDLGDLENRLFEHYLRMTGRGSDFRDSFPHVALARLMQALGAFAYLGGALGKPGYLEHAPRALARVRAMAARSYPQLEKLSIAVAEKIWQPTR